MEFMPLRDALNTMRGGMPFTIKFVTLDKKRKTGGVFKTIEASMLKYTSDSTQKTKLKKNGTVASGQAFPKTISIWESAKRKYVEVHVRLIKEVNGKIITY